MNKNKLQEKKTLLEKHIEKAIKNFIEATDIAPAIKIELYTISEMTGKVRPTTYAVKTEITF